VKRPFCKRCGKRTYPNLAAAFKYALASSAKFGKAFRTYPCPDGHGWHLTSQPRRHVSGRAAA
jgi:hypothetical protein